ncbi:alanine racemase [Microgenomates group bacterium RIFCSPLOWO2_01_FULL_47_10]|nr:MAG: alanine racemase [Microgenomates group bacterium RIFCSPLOWO2_01_FULL_47_10]
MFHKAFSPFNQITISADAIAENYHYFQSTYPQAVFAPVIKSNAYGHGLSEVGPIVDRLHAPYLCVNDMLEAETLRSLRIKTPILILGYTDPKSYQTLKKIPHTLTITDISQLEVLNTYQPGIKVHIKIDTGMNRLGVKLSQIPAFIDVAKNTEAVDFEGIFTHLASADEKEGNAQTKQQIDRFKEALRMFRHYGFLFKWRHVGNTAGASRIKDPDFNMARLGMGLYGYSPFPVLSRLGKLQRKALIPALSFTSHLVAIKTLERGESVGYGATYLATRPAVIGTVPIGYFEGLKRGLSNRGSMLITGVECPIVGRVCMNMAMIDITQVKNPVIGLPVTVVSGNPKHPNTADRLAKTAGTVTHDFLAGLNSSLPRIVKD